MKYSVEITDSAFELIRAPARYIAIDCLAPLNAGRWLESVWEVIDGLESMPEIHNLAPENAFTSYEVRRASVGDYLILFTIDQAAIQGMAHRIPPRWPTSTAAGFAGFATNLMKVPMRCI